MPQNAGGDAPRVLADLSWSEINGLNQYTQAGAPVLSYDADGNQTRMGSYMFAFDADNRLISGDGGAHGLTYDPLGRLWRSTGPGGTTYYLYDGADMVAEYDGAGTRIAAKYR